MVCAVGSLADLCQPSNSSWNAWELDFFRRRVDAEKMLFDPGYFRKMANLPDQMLLVNGLALEASKIDDQYRVFNHGNSSPIYENLIEIYRGVKKRIRKEIEYREGIGA